MTKKMTFLTLAIAFATLPVIGETNKEGVDKEVTQELKCRKPFNPKNICKSPRFSPHYG